MTPGKSQHVTIRNEDIVFFINMVVLADLIITVLLSQVIQQGVFCEDFDFILHEITLHSCFPSVRAEKYLEFGPFCPVCLQFSVSVEYQSMKVELLLLSS